MVKSYEQSKKISPYINKTLRRTKIQGVKCKLTACMRRFKEGVTDPDKIFYYKVIASDGSYRKLTDEQSAITAYEQLIEFEKRQLTIKQ